MEEIRSVWAVKTQAPGNLQMSEEGSGVDQGLTGPSVGNLRRTGKPQMALGYIC